MSSPVPSLDPDERSLHVVAIGAYLQFPHGMAETVRLQLISQALLRAGAKVRVLCLQASERPESVVNTRLRGTHDGVEFEYATWTTVRSHAFWIRRLVAGWGWIHGFWRVIRLRRAGELDIAYLHPIQAPRFNQAALLLLLKALRVPTVWELNERPWTLVAERQSFTRTHWSPLLGMDGVVSISDFLTTWVRDEAKRLHKSVEVLEVPILVDLDERPAAERREVDHPEVLFSGSPCYGSLLNFIVEAMETVWREVPECRLLVTGTKAGDPLSQRIEREAQRYERIEVCGYVSREELLALQGRSRALLIPLFDDDVSRARFPTKIGEYLAAARPVVTTEVGEAARYFNDGVNAVVTPPHDPVAYGKAIVRLLNDPELADEIGRAGRELAASQFQYTLYSETLYKGFVEIVRVARERPRRAARWVFRLASRLRRR